MRQRRDVEQQYVFAFALDDGPLRRGAHGHDFVGIDLAVGFSFEKFLDLLLDVGDARRSSDQEEFVDVADFQIGVVQGPRADLQGLVHLRS